MGAETRCELRLDGASHEGRALLETDELLFRGDAAGGARRGFRLTIPLASIQGVSGANGALRVTFGGGDAVFMLGAQAEKWAARIRSPKSLLDKLDVKTEHVVSVVGIADDAFLNDLRQRAARVVAGRVASGSNVIFIGANNTRALARLAKAADAITRDGAIWVVHPKGANSELRDLEIFAEAKRLGLTYTKVARFSATHTAEKLVIPRAKR
jgi:hypothetical protein